MTHETTKFSRRVSLSILVLLVIFLSIGIPVVANLFSETAETGTAQASQASQPKNDFSYIGLIAAGIAFGLGALGAGIGVGNIGAAAMGAISEKPEIAGNAIIFVALAEGIMVFGFIIAIMILGRV